MGVKQATRGRKLATVAQPCGYPVDGQMDCLHHALVGIASPMTPEQFDLYMVQRIEVGKAVLDRARQQGILVEQCLLAGDGEQHFNRILPFGTQPRKDSFAQLGVLDELRVACSGLALPTPCRSPGALRVFPRQPRSPASVGSCAAPKNYARMPEPV